MEKRRKQASSIKKPVIPLLAVLFLFTSASHAQFGFKFGYSSYRQNLAGDREIKPNLHVDVGDLNINWLVSGGLGINYFTKAAYTGPSNSAEYLRCVSIGPQFRITFRNLEDFIQNRIKDTVRFHKRTIWGCGTVMHMSWIRDYGFKFRPYLTLFPRIDINIDPGTENSIPERSGTGLSGFFGIHFMSIKLFTTKLNVYSEAGYSYDFYQLNTTGRRYAAPVFRLGAKLSLDPWFDSDHGPHEGFNQNSVLYKGGEARRKKTKKRREAGKRPLPMIGL